MANKRNIPFGDAVSNAMKKHFHEFKLQKSGKESIIEIMQEVHSSLMKNFEDEYESSEKITDGGVIKCIQKAVGKTFPTDIKRLSLAEANRQLLLFQSGELEYDPVKSIKAIKSSPKPKTDKKKKTGTVYDAFSRAAVKACSIIEPDLKLDVQAKQFIGYHIYKIANAIATKASERAAGKAVLEYRDIRNVLPEFLTSRILELAYSEGCRVLTDHVHGNNPFKPRKPSISEQPLLSADPAFLKGSKSEKRQTDVSNIEELASSSKFKAGIKKLLSEQFNITPPRGLDEGSKEILKVTCSLVDFLSNQVAELSHRKNLKEIDFTHVREVVAENFPHNLQEHAIYSGLKSVKSFVDGELKYRKRAKPTPKLDLKQRKKSGESERPKKKIKTGSKRSESKKIKKPKSKPGRADSSSSKKLARSIDTDVEKPVRHGKINFSNGILDLLQRYKNVSIGGGATERINSHLLEICNSMISNCTAQQSSVTAETVRSAIENFFPQQIARHAIAEGEKGLKISMINLQSDEVVDEIQRDIPEKAATQIEKTELTSKQQDIKKEPEPVVEDVNVTPEPVVEGEEENVLDDEPPDA